MKRLTITILAALAAFVVSCEKYDDTDIWSKINQHQATIDDHEKRIAALEALGKTVNSEMEKIRALAGASVGKTYIESCVPVTLDGKTVGYNIRLSDGTAMTLMSGTDGKDGADGSDGKDGATPSIGENGNWWVGSEDTGVPATIRGKDGADGLTPEIKDGNWWIGGEDTGVKAEGTDGKDGTDGISPVIGENGNWFLGDEDTGIPATVKGKDGVDGLTPEIKDGNWWIGDKDTGIKAAGIDGKDAPVPVIGAKKDADGAIYWTLDGEWLLDQNGNKIPCTGPKGADGKDGGEVTGEPGKDGTDGVTPRLRITDEGRWEISYDEGATWEDLGQATGDKGESGADGKDDSVLFKSVTVTTAGGKTYLVFTLLDGTTYKIEVA